MAIRLIEYKISLSVMNIAKISFLICYGMYDFGMSLSLSHLDSPFATLHAIVYNICLAISAILVFSIKSTSGPIINICVKDVLIIFAFSIIFTIFHFRIFRTFVSGDELAFISNAWHHELRVLEVFQQNDLPRGMHVWRAQNAIQVLSIITIFLFALTLRFRLIDRCNALIGISLMFIFKTINELFFHFSFQYLSGYVAPIKLASAFAPTDFSIRFFYFVLFCTIIYFGVGARKWLHIRTSLIIIAVACTPTFGHSLAVIDTVNFYIAFGIVVLIRLVRKDYAYETTLLISCLGVFFRPANMIWVFLVLAIRHLNWQRIKLSRIELFSFALISPFVIEVLFRVLATMRTPPISSMATSVFSEENSRYLVFLRSIGSALDPALLVLFALSLFAVVISRSFRYIFIIYLILILSFYLSTIPNGIVGHNKYPIEVSIPITCVGLIALLESLARFTRLITSLSILFVVISIIASSYVSSHADYDFSLTDLRTEQVGTFISMPIEDKVNIKDLAITKRLLTCVNPGVIYGDSYYILRNATVFDVLKNKDIRSSVGTDSGFYESLISKNFDCVILDDYSDKSGIGAELSSQGWHRAIRREGRVFHARLEVWSQSK